MQKEEYIQKNCCYGYKKENDTLEIRSQKTALYNPYIWSATTIKRILNDEQYIGTYIMRKTAVQELGEKRIKREQKDWIKIPNHHKAIIEKNIFEQVQKQLSHLKIESKKQKQYLLKGKVYCGSCYHHMDRRPKKVLYLYADTLK